MSPPDHAPHVLFLCLGNICRSPLAEGAFVDAVKNAGLTAHVDSAGTGGWHAGERPDPRSIAVAREFGVDISHQRARQLRGDDFATFDWIIAMDPDNVRNAARMRPTGDRFAKARLVPFIDFVPTQSRRGHLGVPDPYYGELDGFRDVWALLGAGMPDLVAAVFRQA
jgi:protein-tyrosine phosphatase